MEFLVLNRTMVRLLTFEFTTRRSSKDLSSIRNRNHGHGTTLRFNNRSQVLTNGFGSTVSSTSSLRFYRFEKGEKRRSTKGHPSTLENPLNW